MVMVGPFSLDRLREGGWHGQINYNLIVRKGLKKFEMDNKLKKENSPSPSSPHNRGQEDGDGGTLFP